MIIIKSEKQHASDVALIQKQMGGTFARTSKSSNALHDKSYRKNCHKVDCSSLNSLCSIDYENLIATVEPGVTMQALCKETLKYNLLPQVVPEFKMITVGGAIMGAAIESSSHKFGQFSDTCTEYELLLGDGTLVTATPSHELFSALPGSYGTLALLTKAKIKLRKAKQYVELEYRKYDGIKSGNDDFIEGVLFEKNRGVVITGNFAEQSTLPLFQQKSHGAKWFYQHIKEITYTKEQMPVMDYLFRYDLGAFWMGRFLLKTPLLLQTLLHFKLQNVAKKIALQNPEVNPSFLWRHLFGRVFSAKSLYSLFHRVPKEIMEKLFFIHDFYVPLRNFEAALEEFSDRCGITPIWLCPVKAGGQKQFLSPHFGEENFINIGLYGKPLSQTPLELTRTLERRIPELHGRKMLYSFSYYSPEEFSKIYNGRKYDLLRKKYRAENRFPSLYEKVCSWQ